MLDPVSERILIIGAGGMLGKRLVASICNDAKNKPSDKIFLSYYNNEKLAENKSPSFEQLCLDVTSSKEVSSVFDKIRPTVVINCSAYTNVDAAESNAYDAYNVNAMSVANIARSCKEHRSYLIHISTDYVFGESLSKKPYKETDDCSPCGIYGHSKYLGERFIEEIYTEGSAILRTSWLHGIGGKNFLETIYKFAKERDEISVVGDQYGSPTWCDWLADVILKFAEVKEVGVFHTCSQGEISWFDFASEIVSYKNLKTKVKKVTSEEFKRDAPRPAFSVLCVNKLKEMNIIAVPDWKEGIHKHLDQLES